MIRPGPWEIAIEDFPPDSYSLVLDADGYAEQRLNITYKDDHFVAVSESGNTLTLYKNRYVTFEIVWNDQQERDLSNADVLRETVCATHNERHTVIGPDFSIIQTLAESKCASYPSIWHRPKALNVYRRAHHVGGARKTSPREWAFNCPNRASRDLPRSRR